MVEINFIKHLYFLDELKNRYETQHNSSFKYTLYSNVNNYNVIKINVSIETHGSYYGLEININYFENNKIQLICIENGDGLVKPYTNENFKSLTELETGLKKLI